MSATLKPAISLTFDDGPDPVWTPRILAALRAVGAEATFFVCAPAVARAPGVYEEIVSQGHEVGFHCHEHVRHSLCTRDQIEADTERGLGVLEARGVRPRLWRTPWGDLAPFSPELAEQFGLAIQGWTEDTQDWRGDSAAEMLDVVGPDIAPGSVVLMHDGIGPGAPRDGCGHTQALVAPLVALARQLGLEPVTAGKLTGLAESSRRGAEPVEIA